VLAGGAKKDNVFWVLGTALTMGADSILVGNVLAGSAITIGTNGSIKGRAIAQTAVTCETGCSIETNNRYSAPAEFGEGEGSAECKDGTACTGTKIAREYAQAIIVCVNSKWATKNNCIGNKAEMKLVVYA
jgi:hypothetical protein